MMDIAGYSKTPLYKKIGVQEGDIVSLINAPQEYKEYLRTSVSGIELYEDIVSNVNIIHYFAANKQLLLKDFPRLKKALSVRSILWISWPKKSSGVLTDITEEDIRNIGLANGLVDTKVAAIDTTWSGLKFVYRLQDR